jgi:putative transposase
VIGNLINETGCKTIIVNGTHDHIHCFFGLKPDISVSDLMKATKSKSSKWINENKPLGHKFEWQGGFGSFSYSRSHIGKVYHYILNQEKHHEKKIFREEYLEMLRRFGVQYDEKYLFKEMI